MTTTKPRNLRISLIVLLVAGITFLHYSTHKGPYYYLVFYGELYFLPIVLAGFWFGIRAALAASIGITVCYTPYIVLHWQGFSLVDLDRMLSMALYNLSAIIIGLLKDREAIANEQLLKTESLAAMGKSLAAVAHDIKTPLVIIGGFARRLQKKFTADDPNYEKLKIIIQETEQLEKMMHNMLDFSKPLALQLSQGDINKIVQDSSRTIVSEKAEKKEVAIDYKLFPHLPLVAFDVVRIKQVIVNLVLNAVEASPEGGVVTLCTSDTDNGVIIDVADCGSGLPSEVRMQVFDPFFTTKKEGTGLGLAIVKKIVEAHKGTLELIDNAPKGIIFRIVLPKT
jgi:two-component system, NtrC family, sensor histidine kinase HydH